MTRDTDTGVSGIDDLEGYAVAVTAKQFASQLPVVIPGHRPQSLVILSKQRSPLSRRGAKSIYRESCNDELYNTHKRDD